MVNKYEDIIQPPEQFRDAYKPIPPTRIGEWKNLKPKSVPRKSVKQMVKEYEDIIEPPEQFREGYKPITKPRADRPLQMGENQNVRKNRQNLRDYHHHHQKESRKSQIP